MRRTNVPDKGSRNETAIDTACTQFKRSLMQALNGNPALFGSATVTMTFKEGVADFFSCEVKETTKCNALTA